jgi:chorismate synthase
MLTLTTAGESHGPALVAILAGLPAGLVLDRGAIDADLRRRQQGYGRSPRQQLEQDEVEVLAGLRQGRGRRLRSSSATAITRTGRGE